MAAPRSSSLRALRLLSQHHHATSAVRRGLHITGVNSAQPANPADKASLYASRTLSDLKAECQRRSLRIIGSKSDLIERLSNHDVLQSRAFSIAMKRINGSAFTENNTRQFNTSRAQKAVNDSSTVDFAYMPSLAELEAPVSRTAGPQVPILPDLYSTAAAASSLSTTIPAAAAPMKPQIYTVSGNADVSASPMSEVVDNHAMDIDPFSLTETVNKARTNEAIQRQSAGHLEPGVVQQLWSGFLDDLLGPKQSTKTH
ncbi:hypothetical protein ASPZODRAFT_153620 [Penicilliopsis zonata CBS 506.65]|uniref:SAP domain-containing protein n=1 Tax=Penicilliopsis zonata CBS 506.65 TaxID=1073090 RepID=A0A1L9SC58_9EURO|nr:hypothetical protein ASPZODRAFT_153620 [Penicilliopsis zonata CBS 506.65]OJJ44733.1 hypothetical protein ASPZODRAFT_153620 [Penicilliopsis zonata CBS 506.65]